ncbi:beta-microseminoprotein-like [Bufo gargarizans]|uniref:beta-microseminoprotein-like n=1 Tax=Bufo gargarizans TaxID=30331 RepID=UPI001CF4A1C8|nr:beta-microseminoprotein-like [Bufo gargarizans]
MHQKSIVGSLAGFLLTYSLLVSLCNGVCYNREARLSSPGEKPDGCMDGDIKRAVNSTWFKEECMKCTCDSNGEVDCCSRTLKPLVRDQACEVVLNRTSCTYVIRRKDNSREPCESWALM